MTITTEPISLYDSGLKAFDMDELVDAEKYWLLAAAEATTDTSRKVADGLSALATRYLRTDGERVSTERLFMRAIELRQRFFAENDESLAIEFNNIGMFYEGEDQDRAIEYLEKSVAILETYPELYKPNLADPYDNLAAILFETGCYERARYLSKVALEVRDKTMGPLNPFSLKSLELCAAIEKAIKSHSRSAREYYKEFSGRLEPLAAEYDRIGDHLLSETMLVAAHCDEETASELISTALETLALDCIIKGRV